MFQRLTSMLILVVVITGGLAVAGPASPVEAYTGTDFSAGYIISDANMYDSNAMPAAQIQSFLTQMEPSCGTSNCLRLARTTSTSRPGDAMCNAYTGVANESTADILFKVQKACGISSKVLLVMLQKEQGLVTNPAPSDTKLDRAMGFACPDDANRPGYCDPNFGGLFNQIYGAASQLKRYGNPPGTSNFFTWYPVGAVSKILYQANNPDCPASNVYVANKATAALYYYTPYQPNAAALANLRGLGDGCSAYGNRNFWVYYNDWFGSTTGATSPLGYIDQISGGPGGISFKGWAIDPDSIDPIDVHLYIDSSSVARRASTPRPDVQAVYPQFGPAHGYSYFVPASVGVHQACVWGINVLFGGNAFFGCRQVEVKSGSPFGSLDAVTILPQKVTTTGWAIDPDTAVSIPVHLYIDGVGKAYTADVQQPVIALNNPGYGGKHGFSIATPVTPGPHTVCAYGINTGAGAHTLLGCRDLVVPSSEPDLGRTPFGTLDDVIVSGESIWVDGWALDPDTSAPIAVHVYLDGVGQAIKADGYRPDVGAVYRDHGPLHGYSVALSTSPGPHTVCTYGINDGAGVHALLGCRTVSTANLPPVGNFETAVGGQGIITVGGWALIPGLAESIPVHVYVDGVGVAKPTDQAREDVDQAYRGIGPVHGFSLNLPAGAGTHSVCIYAIDTIALHHTYLGCKSVTVP